MRLTHLPSSAAIALALAAVPTFARAQASNPQTSAPAANDQSPTQDTDAQTPGSTDIIVTAQRRAESTTRVPISLTVRDSEQLAQLGVETIRDLHVGTPGLRIDRNGISLQPSIRGVTALDGNVGNDANVSLYVDGVYRPNPAANNIDLPDVQQVEVLKGPQGTLFGRNATGGAIRITTLRPSFETQGSATLGYGSFNDVTAKGFLTGPVIGDTVAAGVSGYYQRNDGYLDDLTRGGRSTGKLRSFLARGKLLVQPRDGVEILLAGHYADRSDGSLAGQPFLGNTAARGAAGVIIPTRAYDIANNNEPRVDVKEYSFSADAKFDLGDVDFNSITAYNHVKVFSPVESDYTNINQQYFLTNTTQKTFSQEFILSSSGSGRLGWLAGAFYYDDDARYDPLGVVTNGAPFNIFGRQATKAYSAFGEVNFEVVPRLTLIGGLRYSDEKRTLSGSFGTNAYPRIASASFDDVTPRASIRYEMPNGANVYATYSKGFKSGGFSSSSLNATPFRPEKLTAYEVGLKIPQREGVRASVAAFYYDYANQQVQAATTLANGTTVGTTTNAASSEIYGAEFEGSVDLTRTFSLLTTVSLLHARYDSFPAAFAQVPRRIGGAICYCGNVGALVNATGNQLVRAPDFTTSVTLNYSEAFDIGTIDANATFYASDSFFFTPDNRVGQPAYGTLAARVAWTTADRHWKVAVFGRNLTDEVVYQGASILPAADGVLFAPPRTFGIEVTRAF